MPSMGYIRHALAVASKYLPLALERKSGAGYKLVRSDTRQDLTEWGTRKEVTAWLEGFVYAKQEVP